MPLPFVVTGATAFGIALLLILFRVERTRGSRFFESVRTRLDHGALRLIHFFQKAGKFVGRDVIRGSMHYLFHHVLNGLRRGIRSLEAYVSNLMHVNHTIATTHTRSPDGNSSLAKVARHKEENALTEEERKARKEDSIGTRL